MNPIVPVFAFVINTIPYLPLVKKQREFRGAMMRLARGSVWLPLRPELLAAPCDAVAAFYIYSKL